MARLADLAVRNPAALLAANLVVCAAALVLAIGAPDRLGIGSLALNDEAGTAGGGAAEPDLVIATTGSRSVRSGPYRVALRVISAQLGSNPEVASVRRGPISGARRSAYLVVSLTPNDDADRQRAVERIEGEIDPGPLHVAYGGEVATLLEARHDLSGDLWKLLLLVVPVALLVLAGGLGPRLAIAPALCATTAVAGTLAGLRIIGAVADISLLGFAPAAVLGLALGIEAPSLLVARFGDEATSASRGEAIRRALEAAGEVAVPLGLGATAATAGLVATSLDQAPSMLLGCALASALAVGSALVCTPAVLALWPPKPGASASGASGEPRLAWGPRVLARSVAASRVRTVTVGIVVVAIMVAAALPLLHGKSQPFSARDLPTGSQARHAALVVGKAGGRPAAAPGPSGVTQSSGAPDESVFGKLPLATGISMVALALILGIAFSPRAIPVAIVTILPAAAACGLCVLMFQDGHLASAIGLRRQGALETGAVASLLAALVSVSAARAVTALRAARGERSLGLEPGQAAETAAAFTVPAAIMATLIAGLAAGALAGSDLYPAREFGLAVAVGLLIDLVLLRVPLLAALARWGGAD